jgi:hypothetical protein
MTGIYIKWRAEMKFMTRRTGHSSSDQGRNEYILKRKVDLRENKLA